MLGAEKGFDYIGMDISQTMREFGERLATAAEDLKEMPQVRRHWTVDLPSFSWSAPPGWRPVIIIASYLLASGTLDVKKLVGELQALLPQFGHGQATLVYTNSVCDKANESFPVFRNELGGLGFELLVDKKGEIMIERRSVPKDRKLRYALFHRPPQTTLQL